MIKNKLFRLAIVVSLGFFLFNSLWIIVDKQVPTIGDDARWLQESYEFSQVVRSMDMGAVWEKWQNMFITDTNSFPRTPLFTLLAVPVFMLLGPNEDAALIFNAFFVVVNSVLGYKLVVELFAKNKSKHGIAFLSVLFYNLLPGTFGFARLFMSETLQMTFVLLLTYVFFKYRKSDSKKIYAWLGVLLALGLLLRLLMPIYVLVPGLVYIWNQFGKIRRFSVKEKLKYFLLRGLIFMVFFLPIFLSWYGQNGIAYLEFTRYTTSGELADVTSLDSSNPLVAIIKFWGVIVLWRIGWPFLVILATGLAGYLVLNRKNLRIIFKQEKSLVLTALSVLPALLMVSLSTNKTARYFMPVEFFVCIICGFLVMNLLSNKLFRIFFGSIAAIMMFVFIRSIVPGLFSIPYSSYILTNNIYQTDDGFTAPYEFVYQFYLNDRNDLKDKDFYIAVEETRFNDAELEWYFTQKGIDLNNRGEFSPYETIEKATVELEESEVVIVEDNPEVNDRYIQKFEDFQEIINRHPELLLVSERTFTDNSVKMIFIRVE